MFCPQKKLEFCTAQRLSFREYPKQCKDLDLSLLCILTWGTYGKSGRKNNFLVLGV